MNEEQLQQKYLQFQLLEQQIQQIQQQILTLEQQILEFRTVEESLTSISKTQNDTKLFSPLGLGMFIETELKNNKEILMNVGSKVVVKKSLEEAKEILKNKSIEMAEAIKSLQNILLNNITIATDLNNEIETEISKLKKK